MTDGTNQRSWMPRFVQNLPADLAAILVAAIATITAVVVPAVDTTPLRVVLAVPIVLFVPGYALVAVLFPNGTQAALSETAIREPTKQTDDQGGITWMERIALSFASSIAVVSIIGLILNTTPIGIQLRAVLLSVSGVSLGLIYPAVSRRARLPESERLVVPYRAWARSVASNFSGHTSWSDHLLSVVVLLSVVLVVASVGYAFVEPQQADAFSELYLVTEQEDGGLVAAEYPTEFTVGESHPLIVGVGNHEHRTVEYSLVVELQEATVDNGSVTVHESQELYREQSTVANGETWHDEVDITPEMDGQELRLSFMIFKGDAPSDPTVDNAYRETHLWISVSDGS